MAFGAGHGTQRPSTTVAHGQRNPPAAINGLLPTARANARHPAPDRSPPAAAGALASRLEPAFGWNERGNSFPRRGLGATTWSEPLEKRRPGD